MRKYLILLFCSLFTLADATVNMRDVLKSLPDSIIPLLSENNRLDLIDFMDSNMKAEVKNQFDGKSEMTVMTDDSLSIRMNDALRVDMLLLKLDEPLDTISRVLVFVETFKSDSVYGDRSLKYFTPTWQQIKKDIPLNEIQRRRIRSLGLQNILKWDSKIFNES